MDKFLDKLNKMVPQKWQWILSHQGFRKYFKNMGWMFFGQMFSLLVSFFVGAWLARYLGPDNFGIFNYSLAFSGLFGFIAPLGIDIILNRELVVNPERRDDLMGTAFFLKLIGGLLAFLFSIIFVYYLESSHLIRIMVLLFSLGFIINSLNIIGTFFNSKVESKKNVQVVLFSSSLSACMKIAVIIFGLGLIWLAVVFFIETIFQSFGFFLAYKNSNLNIKNWKFSKVLAINILKKSWFLMLASAAAFIYLKIDQIIIGKMMGVREVGLYAAAVKIAEIWYFIPGIICGSLFPAIINSKKIGETIYRHRLKNLYLLMFFLSVLIAIPISLFGNFFVSCIFGLDYIGATSVLKIYIWAGVGVFLGTAINQYLISENMIRTILVLNVFSMILNIGLNLYLIPIIGLNGAAIATLISYFTIPIFIFSFERFFKEKIK